jgi:predicted ATPase
MLVERAYIPEFKRPADYDAWPYTVPCVAELADDGLAFERPITFLVGENGSGKSTITEALAEAFKFDDRAAATSAPTPPTGRRRRSARCCNWT